MLDPNSPVPLAVEHSTRYALISRVTGPTGSRGTTITAWTTPKDTARRQRVAIPYDHALSADANHEAAVRKLLGMLSYTTPPGRLVAAFAPSIDYMVWALLD